MVGANIVFMDIVAFSTNAVETQKELIDKLTAEVAHELRGQLLPPRGDPEVIALPTGDGMAVAFLGSDRPTWGPATVFGFILRLQVWAYREQIALRLGVHNGEVELVTDINGQTNVCGDTVNYAQRVMDAANSRQVLLSDGAYRSLVGSGGRGLDDPLAEFPAPTQVTAKHGWQIHVHPMHLLHREPEDGAAYPEAYEVGLWNERREPKFWDNGTPDSKWRLSVSVTAMPKTGNERDREGRTWHDYRKKAQRLAFVQPTGEDLHGRLERALNAREAREADGGDDPLESEVSRDLKTFWVFLPTAACEEQLGGTAFTGQDDPVDVWVERWGDLLVRLAAARPQAAIHLWRVPVLGYHGSYVDWERRGGRIHVCPYVWGAEARRSSAFDFVWEGDTPPPPYQAYLEGLERLRDLAEADRAGT